MVVVVGCARVDTVPMVSREVVATVVCFFLRRDGKLIASIKKQ